jgi:RHH-type proline utilization regulon transcriptional repressor/proline dehydrogenase/delta 1-pyrroline-5-carboxylate dehydrogenase
VARYIQANAEDIGRAVRTARQDPDGWRDLSARERHRVLSRVALEVRRQRADLIGAAAADTGKVFTEADPEVSEAIDFLEYYPHTVRSFDAIEGLQCRGKGVGVVISPWNFPIAIPCGGISAALAAGNTVLFKPSSDAVLTAWILCQCFWRAGVSQNTLQFIPCSGTDAGRNLTNHPEVDFVILTGGTETGLRILEQRPDLFLAAETGGKNSTIVTAMADRDQAIRNVIYSAFGNCGQKCSATSLLILEKEVYDDEHFRQQLVDATRSWAAGSAWDLNNRMGPHIRPPQGELRQALTVLEPEEFWALEPTNIQGNPHLWTPGIKWNVQPASFTHYTEFFGAVLGVMRAANLDHAIELANATGYGLTAGLESLDRREQERWTALIKAGNLYINRGTTGAIVLRQPFGGMGKSALGPGLKAGSPNYVSQFMDFKSTALPSAGAIAGDHPLLELARQWQLKLQWGQWPQYHDALAKVIRAIRSYLYHFETEFGTAKDYFHLRGQDNLVRYLPLGRVIIRVHAEDDLFEVLARIAAARIAGCRPQLSLPENGEADDVADFLQHAHGQRLLGGITVYHHSNEALIARMPQVDRIRYASPARVPADVRQAAAAIGFYIADSPVLMEGRLELLHYFRNQSVCDSYHRYGNLGERGLDITG